MAAALWGKVFYQDTYAGVLREEPGECASFVYDESYLVSGNPPIAHTLPLQSEPLISLAPLHPFFDNLIAEGWLEEAQKRLLKKRIASRFELLLAFGFDCAGAVWVSDPIPERLSQSMIDKDDSKELAVYTSRASLSGIQPKLAIVEHHGKYYPAKNHELSSHIAKFASLHHPDLLANEYLSTKIMEKLLPDDHIVEMKIGTIEGLADEALIIKRFDRSTNGRIHFEEFNSLLGYMSAQKYSGEYREISDFIQTNPGCQSVEIYKLYRRILAGLLLGNTDMHFKNFAMFHTSEGLRLTPTYDAVSAVLYGYKTLALSIDNIENIRITDLKDSHLIRLGNEFNLSTELIEVTVKKLEKNLDAAKEAVLDGQIGSQQLKNALIQTLEKRWSGTFTSIGKVLSRKR